MYFSLTQNNYLTPPEKPTYIFLNFHRPLRNKTAPATASSVQAIGVALNTPVGPA
jgi:hypothetical protein